MGTAVVNDATAVYYNPAALKLLKNPQIIGLDSFGHVQREFTGEARQSLTGFMQKGTTITENNYQLPAFYVAIPVKKMFTVGLAVISNLFDKDIDGNSILRYDQSNNRVRNTDIVPALQFKLNDSVSLGAAMNFSSGSFLLMPTVGFPSLNIPDAQSRNECSGHGTGHDFGILVTPNKSTIIGLNYRSSITYQLSGTSVFEGNIRVFSNRYGFTFWTPARTVLSVNQVITKKLAMIATVHRIQWSIFNEINIHGIATAIGPLPLILDAKVPYHLRDTWLGTLGGQYRILPKLVLRVAGSYNQTPGNGKFQISNGDSVILGTSMGYELFKNIVVDAAYAHAFVLKEDINITNARNDINGVTKGYVDVVSVKLTFNL